MGSDAGRDVPRDPDELEVAVAIVDPVDAGGGRELAIQRLRTLGDGDKLGLRELPEGSRDDEGGGGGGRAAPGEGGGGGRAQGRGAAKKSDRRNRRRERRGEGGEGVGRGTSTETGEGLESAEMEGCGHLFPFSFYPGENYQGIADMVTEYIRTQLGYVL